MIFKIIIGSFLTHYLEKVEPDALHLSVGYALRKEPEKFSRINPNRPVTNNPRRGGASRRTGSELWHSPAAVERATWWELTPAFQGDMSDDVKCRSSYPGKPKVLWPALWQQPHQKPCSGTNEITVDHIWVQNPQNRCQLLDVWLLLILWGLFNIVGSETVLYSPGWLWLNNVAEVILNSWPSCLHYPSLWITSVCSMPGFFC